MDFSFAHVYQVTRLRLKSANEDHLSDGSFELGN